MTFLSCYTQLVTTFQYVIREVLHGFISPGTGTLLGNPRGTLMKQRRTRPYGGIIWRNMDKIWGKCGQDLGPILATHMRPILHIGNWQPTWEPYEAGGQKPYGPHMGCSYLPHIVVQMGPMCGPCLCASWVHLKIVF